MAEVFWNSWLDENAEESINNLFDAILLKNESPFPDQIIVPEFTEREKIVFTTVVPPYFSFHQNQLLMDIVKRVMDFVPKKCQTKILLSTCNDKYSSVWKEKFYNCKLLSEDYFIEHKKPVRDTSPFSTNQPKPFFLPSWYLPLEIDTADQIIPIIPFNKSPIFQVLGIISSFFWFLPTKIRNEILIQKTELSKANALIEIVLLFFKKITLSGVLHQGLKNFAVFGNDPVAVDAFASALLSIRASTVLTTKLCKKNKIGMGDLLKIHVQGERFLKPITKSLESFKQKYQLFFDSSSCNMCRLCLESCPYQAIILKDGTLLYYKNKCSQCGFCVSLCPMNSIKQV